MPLAKSAGVHTSRTSVVKPLATARLVIVAMADLKAKFGTVADAAKQPHDQALKNFRRAMDAGLSQGSDTDGDDPLSISIRDGRLFLSEMVDILKADAEIVLGENVEVLKPLHL